jgi:uncharacterized membrane protein
MDIREMKEWIIRNPGKTIGAVAGLLIGVFVFTIGFLKTFVIILLIVDDGRPLSDQINDFFNRNKMT